MEYLLDSLGDDTILALAGVIVGLLFGACAQHSRFCLRAATVEVSDGRFGPRMSVWLIVFTTAVVAVQGAILMGTLDVGNSRQLASVGSLSGAIIGGLLFGAGMILARGCASRLLVLSATGNLRAVLTGLVLTLVAQASLRGALSPLREGLASLWVVDGGDARNLLAGIGAGPEIAAIGGAMVLGGAVLLAVRREVGVSHIVAAGGVGAAVALGWLSTYAIASTSFEPIAISSVTFTGPSTDTLMGLVNTRELPLGFGIGLVPGVLAGAFAMAVLTRQFKIERFGADTPMERYLIGAVLMGFGSMLAGGCAVGAGVTGGAIFALTAWVAIFCMWVGAVTTDRLLKAGGFGVPAPQPDTRPL